MSAGRYLVTGGAGFIGAAIARRLVQAGHDVTVLDDLSTGREANIPKGARLLKLSLADPDFTAQLPKDRFDAVLHLAAQSSGEVSSEDPMHDFRVNLAGTVALLYWSAKNTGRFLYASSMAAYGQPDLLPVTESTPLKPLSFYGVNKACSEEYVRRLSTPSFSTTSFRMFSVYGPGQNMDNMKQGMLSIYMAYVLAGKPVHVKGSKDRFRDFIYIDDVVDAWLAALGNPVAQGKVYNLASGKKTLVSQAVAAVLSAAAPDPSAYPVKYEGSTPADQFGLYADTALIRRELGWAPKIGLEEGLKRMAAWAKGWRS